MDQKEINNFQLEKIAILNAAAKKFFISSLMGIIFAVVGLIVVIITLFAFSLANLLLLICAGATFYLVILPDINQKKGAYYKASDEYLESLNLKEDEKKEEEDEDESL